MKVDEMGDGAPASAGAKGRRWPPFAFAGSTALASPLSLWSGHVGEVSFGRMMLIGLSLAVVCCAVLAAVRDRRRRNAVSAVMTPAMLVLMYGGLLVEQSGVGGLLGLVVGGAALAYVLYRLFFSDVAAVGAAIFLGAFVLAPVVTGTIQVATDTRSGSIPEVVAGEPTGRTLPDIFFLVLDGYPSAATIHDVLEYDNSPFIAQLESNGFVVFDEARANYSMTHASLASVLMMDYLFDEGDVIGPGETRNLYRVMSGSNSVVATLRSAGYRYVHVESGWNGTRCGSSVDECVSSSLLDEETWNLLRRSVIGPVLRNRIGSGFTSNARRQLQALPDVFVEAEEDGVPTFVFAHVVAPHPPIALDTECGLEYRFGAATHLLESTEVSSDRELVEAYRDQLKCVNRLTTLAMEAARGSEALVVVSGDHGSDFGNQVLRVAEEWTPEQVSERFATLQAYRLPDDCATPPSVEAILVNTFRYVLSCALGSNTPPLSASFFITPALNTGDVPIREISAERFSTADRG